MPHDLIRYKAEDNKRTKMFMDLHNKLSLNQKVHLLPLKANAFYEKEMYYFGTPSQSESEYQHVVLESSQNSLKDATFGVNKD